MKQYLTKTDFNRWMTCRTAAHYGWLGYDSKNDKDPFLSFLAEEGRTVGRMARRLFKDARMVDSLDIETAEAITRRMMGEGDCTLFEACLTDGRFVVRPDVLIRKGRTLYVIEVKSKLGNLRQHREGKLLINCYGDVRAAYREIVHDLAFQVEVLRRACPELSIVPYFLLPEETSRSCEEEVQAARLKEQIVDIPADGAALEKNRVESVLKFFVADKAIDKIQAIVGTEMDAMADVWESGQRPEPKLKYGCRNCEYRLKGERCQTDGFHQCWGQLAKPAPHLFDLHQLYQLKAQENKQVLLADEKIREGTTSLFDIREAELQGEHATRQRLQLNYQQSGEEWIDPELSEEIAGLNWPIAFVDFETTMAAIPWHGGLKPYETLPFQFSVHILHEDGRYEHKEWLNVEDRVPTLPFIQNLRASLEGVSSVMVYTDYENRILSEAIGLLKRLHRDESQEERQWIAELLNSQRIVDQHEWVYRYHFHPQMSGRTSIKVVLSAVWQNNQNLHHHPYFRRYFLEQNGQIVDPY
jgi:hypothetical protein